MSASSHQYDSFSIGGVKILFPCKPYPSQFSMMDKIIKGLDRRQNCLLESPTGSGKTLALLCSVLAWQQKEIDLIESTDAQVYQCLCGETTDQLVEEAHKSNENKDAVSMLLPINDGDDDDFQTEKKKKSKQKKPISLCYEADTIENQPNPASTKNCDKDLNIKVESNENGLCPTCSCVREPQKKRAPKIFFGTRTHKQISQVIRELKKTQYANVRMSILASREHTCVDPEVSSMSNKTENCKLKLQGPGCRFHDNVKRLSHFSLAEAGLNATWDLEDFVQICKSKKIKACPYYGARQLKDHAQIVFCPYNYLIYPSIRLAMDINLNNHIVILDEAHNIEDTAREAGSFSLTQSQLSSTIVELQKMIEKESSAEYYVGLLTMCNDLNQLIDSYIEKLEGNYEQASKVWTGYEIVAELKRIGIGPEHLDELKRYLAKVQEDVTESAMHARTDISVSVLPSASVSVLEGFLGVLDFIYQQEMKFAEDYRVVMLRSREFSDDALSIGRWMSKKRSRGKLVLVHTLNFWCLNPAVVFSHVGETVRSVIVTSGTLSPMNTFQSELGVQFPIQLEAAHVINKSQVWVGAISHGPKGVSLLGNYNNCETLQYQDELGEILLQVCQTIPHGVLCFVSSYKLLEKLSNRWMTTGLWDKISELKSIKVEPKASDRVDFDELLQSFYTVIAETENVGANDTPMTGALFLAVCRGKVSEGMDFADNNARAVITIGIPFPNYYNKQVELKREYNNKLCSSRGLLSGSAWYEIQAFRALNQALGRCIRHKRDWGALILIDERYSKRNGKYINSLSKWVRNSVQFHSHFPTALKSLENFTTDMVQKNSILSESSYSIIEEDSSVHNPISISEMPKKQELNYVLPSQAGGFLSSDISQTNENTNQETESRSLIHPPITSLHSQRSTLFSPDIPSQQTTLFSPLASSTQNSQQSQSPRFPNVRTPVNSRFSCSDSPNTPRTSKTLNTVSKCDLSKITNYTTYNKPGATDLINKTITDPTIFQNVNEANTTDQVSSTFLFNNNKKPPKTEPSEFDSPFTEMENLDFGEELCFKKDEKISNKNRMNRKSTKRKHVLTIAGSSEKKITDTDSAESKNSGLLPNIVDSSPDLISQEEKISIKRRSSYSLRRNSLDSECSKKSEINCIEIDNKESRKLLCSNCDVELLSFSSRGKYIEESPTVLQKSLNYFEKYFVLLSSEINDNQLVLLKDNDGLNSFWCDTDKCCVQILCCSSCKSRTACSVKSVSPSSTISYLSEGQVWFCMSRITLSLT